ncbi:MDS1 and EVI1 complex locus protein EVI1-A-like [Argonauta hians]
MSVRVPSMSAGSPYSTAAAAVSAVVPQMTASSYMCRYCAKQFVSVRDMQLHILQHSRGNAPLNCAICNKSYRTPSKLQRHVRVHSGERPYICNLCGRRFTRSDHLKQHMKVHSPNRQKNMCRLCNARFTSCHLLVSHLRTHEIYQVHLCRFCGEGFTAADELERHKKLHDVKGNIRATRGRRSTVHSMMTDPALDMVNPENGDSLLSEQESLLSGGKPNLQGSKWIGCARFCLSQIPPENNNNNNTTSNDENNNSSSCIDITGVEGVEGSTLDPNRDENGHGHGQGQGHDLDSPSGAELRKRLSPSQAATAAQDRDTEIIVHDEGDNKEDLDDVEIIAEDLSKGRRDTEDTEDSKIDCSNRPKMVVSPLSNPPDTSSSSVMSSLLKGSSPESNLNRSKPFIMPAAPTNLSSPHGEDGYQATLSRTSIPYPPFKGDGSNSLKALIKRESQGLEAQNMSYTRNLLNVPPTLGRPFYVPSQYSSPHLQFSPYPISSAYLELLYNSSSSSNRHHNSSSNSSSFNLSSSSQQQQQQQSSGMSSGARCEHCHIWFEDSAMFMLHNSLHSADDADPFTCKKCMKKMGNRLEFTAHLVWHLDPVIG